MKKKVAKSYILDLPKTYIYFYQKPTKIFDIYKIKVNDYLYIKNYEYDDRNFETKKNELLLVVKDQNFLKINKTS